MTLVWVNVSEPLPAPPLVSKRDVVFGVCLTNRQGRIGDLAITAALGWAPGLRVGFTVTDGVIVVAADEEGSRVLDHRCYLWLPTVVRRAIGVYQPARVLLAGLPSEQRLIIHPMVMLERLTAPVHAAIVGGTE
ncbi:hypothetical protein Ait01nite_101360 [Actinoplanes italicus]|uniref:Uncharacterized protein n=1 Tax=Actinoplanes italicus TaxID=113567 RepID=A0A2T0J721_9ACTN|nr:hypothetical protein CLV67_1552 [Actinoplanes italicus]GIE37091.1 hypothetical protein Ait01nite_101360 [Actinoplanes italicus]